MSTHVLDDNAPTVNPTGASSNDYETIQASPAAFGAAIGGATEKLGSSVTGAADAGLDVMTARANIQNDLMANDGFSNYTKSAAAAWGEYANNNHGQAAIAGLLGFQSKLDDLRKQSLATMPSATAQVQLDNQLRRVQTHFIEASQNFADQEDKKWNINSWSNGAAQAGDSAVLFKNDPSTSETWLKTSDEQIRNLYDDSGADPATKARAIEENRGKNVERLVNEYALTGTNGRPDLDQAQAVFDKYKDQIDVGSQQRIEKQLAAHADRRDSDGAVNRALAASAKTLPSATSNQTTAPSGSVGDPAAVLRHFEGFSPAPYWDVNHWRVGYGSDTTTRADGSIEPVTAMTQVTQADAERDLHRRVQISQRQVKATIGPDTWARLPSAAQASITSVTYNYGHVPASVAQAAQTGDNQALAQSINALGGANGGVNAKRRAQKAGNVLGTFGGNGVPAIIPGGGQTMTMPASVSGASPAASSSLSTTDSTGSPTAPSPIPGGPSAAAAAPTLNTAPPGPGDAPATPTVSDTPEATRADAFRRLMNDPTLKDRPQAMDEAIRKLNMHFTAQQIADEADAKTKKDRNDKAMGGYVTRYLNGDTASLVHDVANDPHLSPETKWSLGKAFQKTADEGVDEASKSYGSGFWKAYQGVTTEPGDPSRITDQNALLHRAGPGGDLTLSGVQKLTQLMHDNLRSVNDQAVNAAKVGLLKYASSKLSFDQEMLFPGGPPMKDPKGAMVFNAQFIPKFEAAYDQWIKDGKDPWQFLTQDNVDKMRKGMRDPTEMAQARIAAGANADSGGSNEPAATLLPPPELHDIDPRVWSRVVSTPIQTADGKPYPAGQWAGAVTMLASNPTPKMIQFFNASKFGSAGYDGTKILSSLGIRPREINAPRAAPPPAAAPAAVELGTGD